MTGTAIENQRDHADLALVVYLEELLRDRRVLLVGETSARVERRLSDAARTVDVISRERRARRRGLPLRAWPTPAERGTWDAIVIPDLAAAGLADAARFEEIAALVPDGIFVAAIDASGTEPGYEGFHALVTARFEGARLLGQAPLTGYALAELGAAAVDVAYDASNAELAPARFVAVAAPRSVAIDGYAVIATPRPVEAAAPVDARHEREAEAIRTRLEHAEKRLEQAQREIARNAQKLDESRHEQARLEEALRAHQAEIERSADHESDAVRAARAECDALEKRLRATAHEVTSLRTENERRGVLVRDLVEELRRSGAQAAIAVAPTRGEIDAELGRAQEALATAQRRAVEAEARRAELAFRVDELTADLASIGQAHEARIAQIVREHASAQGAARGLLAKVGELTELRLVAESRLALVEDDVRRARDKGRDLERRLAEMEEQLELARMQRPAPRVESGDPGREGQLFGALLRAREELAALQQERVELVGEVARLRTAVEIAAHETEAGVSEARRRAAALEAEAALRAGQLEHRNTELANVREERDTLASRVVALESVLPPPPVVEVAAAAPSEDHENALDALRGEIAGLTLRAQNAEASADAALERARGLSGQIDASESAARADSRRAAELASRLAARDALISRLSSELAHATERHAAAERVASAIEARLAAASESIGALEAVSSVRSDEERRERDALLLDLASEKSRAAELDTERASALEALRDVREALARLQAGVGESARSSAIPTAPEGIYREEIARLARDVDDRELMLRSLTAQLEERDDRIRALERVARGDVAMADATKMIENEERVARLTAELAEERRARERVESSSALVSREAELRRLEQLIGDRDAQLMLLEGRIEGASREERVLRDAFAQTRAALETVLGHLGADRHGAAAEHAAELLRTLRKY